MSEVIHVAGPTITIGPLIRQRCAWCGAVLIDHDMRRVAVPVGQDPTPATWPVGAFVAVDGNMKSVVAHDDSQPLPSSHCGMIDPTVTV